MGTTLLDISAQGQNFPPAKFNFQEDLFVSDGSASVTLSKTPADGVQVYRNGLRLVSPNDFSLAGAVVTWAVGATPKIGDTIVADYRF